MSQKGDFIGFSFDGIHSSELGIVRTSEGSRYNDNLLPNIQDSTVEVPGKDGMYYFGSSFKQREFNISIAFDSLTEDKLRRLKSVFSTKDIKPLIFDEAPYKKYYVKLNTQPTFSYICFDESYDELYDESHDLLYCELYNKPCDESENSNGSTSGSTSGSVDESTNGSTDENNKLKRIYKGEGNLKFIAYYPFARSVHKTLDKYLDTEIENKKEWALSSGMLETLGDYDSFKKSTESTNSYYAKIYNPGDLETDFKIYFKFINGSTPLTLEKIYLGNSSDSGNSAMYQIEFDKNIKQLGNDSGFIFDTKTNLLQGIDSDNKLTGNLYNKHIINGSFFKIPVTTDYGIHVVGAEPDRIEYYYIYF